MFNDLPAIYNLDRPLLLFTLLKIVANRPGLLLDYKHLAHDLKIDHRTLANYIGYLEYGLLVQKAYNFSKNFMTSEKKLKKIYLSNPAFTYSLAPDVDQGQLMEQYFVNWLKANFFYRNPQKEEIDLILESGNQPVPVEIKIRNKIQPRTLKPMLKFLKKYGLRTGYLISEDTHELLSRDQYQIEIIPYWKYWTIARKLAGKKG